MLHTEALNRRLPENHTRKQLVNRDAIILRTSYKGEKAIEFPLSFLPNEEYHILHDLRLPDTNGYFQIDILLISPYVTIIIEVKNVYGTVIYDGMGQTIRLAEDIEQGFKNPVKQVHLQYLRLKRWLNRNSLPSFPLERLVVYSNPSTIIKNINNNKDIANIVIQKESLLSRIENYSKLYKTAHLTRGQINKIVHKLISAHCPVDDDVLKKYAISANELLRGVICPKCRKFAMKRIYGKWKCQHCHFKSKNAHLQALSDYKMLVSHLINNRQARDFLQLTSPYTTKRLLQKEGFTKIGNTSGRLYEL